METQCKSDIIKQCKERDVRFVQLWFTDILGQLKSISISPTSLESAIEEGVSFDGSSVEGFARIYESDLAALPDPSTFCILPWTKNGVTTARFICDVVDPNLKPYDGDPRYILKRSMALLKEKRLTPFMGPEIEFFYFADTKSVKAIDDGGYFDLTPLDVGTELRDKTVLALESMGIEVHATHHEVAASQHELDLRYDEALKIADSIMTARLVIKEVARQNNVYATFMPKPIKEKNGSGMHVHQSLFENGNNAFHDSNDNRHLSELARNYIAGLLRHSREFALVTNQWVNSYKRLVPGYEAPAYICWGSKNRSALVRVPFDKPHNPKARRVELRCPDPACNPYLAFAAMIRAGLKGIEERYPLAEPAELDVYLMSPQEREERGIACLPETLYAATEDASKSRLLKETLGEMLFKKLLENKRIEWDNYRTQVTQYEISRYLPIL